MVYQELTGIEKSLNPKNREKRNAFVEFYKQAQALKLPLNAVAIYNLLQSILETSQRIDDDGNPIPNGGFDDTKFPKYFKR